MDATFSACWCFARLCQSASLAASPLYLYVCPYKPSRHVETIMTEQKGTRRRAEVRGEETLVSTAPQQRGQTAPVYRVVIIKNGQFVRPKRRNTETARAS